MPSTISGSDNFDSGEVLGQNQTWQDVGVSRALSTPYTNTTGRPIQVSVKSQQSSSAIDIKLTVDGLDIARQYHGADLQASLTVSAIIPNGSVYSVTANGSPQGWYELR